MPTHEEFAKAICAAPDDDALRLIYADWLEEQGDTENAARAELIRLQIERSLRQKTSGRTPFSTSWSADFETQYEREQAILDKYAKKWVAQLPRLPGILWHEDFERGFIWNVSAVGYRELKANAQTIFHTTPVNSLSIHLRGARAFARLPELAGIRRLIIDDGRLGPDDTKALAASPYLSNLRELWLCGNRIGSEGLRALAQSSTLTSLDFLDVRWNEIENDGIEGLVSSGKLASLRLLSLGDYWIDDEGAKLFAGKSCRLTRLEGLGFASRCDISDKVQALLRKRYKEGVTFDNDP